MVREIVEYIAQQESKCEIYKFALKGFNAKKVCLVNNNCLFPKNSQPTQEANSVYEREMEGYTQPSSLRLPMSILLKLTGFSIDFGMYGFLKMFLADTCTCPKSHSCFCLIVEATVMYIP